MDETCYYEIDTKEVNVPKISCILNSKLLISLLDNDYSTTSSNFELHSKNYNIIDGDVRFWNTAVIPKLHERGFRKELTRCLLLF